MTNRTKVVDNPHDAERACACEPSPEAVVEVAVEQLVHRITAVVNRQQLRVSAVWTHVRMSMVQNTDEGKV